MNKYNKFMAIIATLVFLPSYSFAKEENYVLDPNHTNVIWSANHFGFSNVLGKFTKVEGKLTLDEDKPENSKVNVVVTTSSLITGIDKFDTHLKSDAFLDVGKFPVATFQSNKVEIIAVGKSAKVYGNLTLHGVTKPLVLVVNLNKIGTSPISNKKVAGFSAATTIKRSEFGINFALPGVADFVNLIIESEAELQ